VRIVISRLSVDEPANGNETGVIVAASTVAIVAIAAAVTVVALLARYVLLRGRPTKAVTSQVGDYRASARTRRRRALLLRGRRDSRFRIIPSFAAAVSETQSSAGSPEPAAGPGFASRSGSWANATTPEA
jgi:hypothetical protein